MKKFIKHLFQLLAKRWFFSSFCILACGCLIAADEGKMRRDQVLPAEEVFETWDTILSCARSTDGAIICAVFERQTVEKVYEFWIGEEQLKGGDALRGNAMVGLLREAAIRECKRAIGVESFLRTSIPDGKAWNPGFVCVILHWPQQKQTVTTTIGFATKLEALHFADAFKKATKFARKKAKP